MSQEFRLPRNILSTGTSGKIIDIANRALERGYKENNVFKKLAGIALLFGVGWPVNVAISMAKAIGQNTKK